MARIPINSGGYPEFAQASTGGATYPPYASIAEAAFQSNPNYRLAFGDSIVDKFGNCYVYVRATGSLTAGAVVRRAITGDGDIPAAGTVSASTTTKVVFTNITTTLNEAGLGSFLASPGTVATGAGQPFYQPIKAINAIGANTQFTLSKKQILFGINQFDGDVLASIPVTSDPVAICRPFNVVVHAAAAGTTKEGGPVGVALGTVSAGQGTLIMVSGVCQVQAVGNGAAIVANGPVVSGASGIVKGPGTAAAGLDQDEIPSYVGRALVAHSGAGTCLIPVYVQCRDRI